MSAAAPVADVENHEFINKLAKKLPAIWPGYALGAVFYFTAAYVFAVYGRAGLHPALFIVSISSFLYYLYCIYRFYSVLESVPGWNSPNSAWGAVGRHFIPIYSYFWLFEWTSQIAEFVNWRTQKSRMRERLPAALLLLSFFGRFWDVSIACILMFSVMVYIKRCLKDALVSPTDALPPAPSFTSTLNLNG